MEASSARGTRGEEQPGLWHRVVGLSFERIRHAYLLQAAIKHDYPLWLLRLSLATYRLFRAVRVGNAYSQVVQATRGITAGSGFATTEMRLAVLTPLDDAHRAHPTVVPTAFVDDIACELAATATLLLTHLVGFVLMVCNALEEAGNEISRKKSICTASCARVGRDLQKALNKFEIKFQPRVKVWERVWPPVQPGMFLC